MKLIGGSIEAFNEFEDSEMKVLPVVGAIGEALGPQMRLDNLDVSYIVPKKEANPNPYYVPPEEEKKKPEMEALLYLSFPPSMDPEKGFFEVKALEKRLPAHKIGIVKQVAERVYMSGVSGESSAVKEEEARTEDYTAQISIRGPAQ